MEKCSSNTAPPGEPLHVATGALASKALTGARVAGEVDDKLLRTASKAIVKILNPLYMSGRIGSKVCLGSNVCRWAALSLFVRVS